MLSLNKSRLSEAICLRCCAAAASLAVLAKPDLEFDPFKGFRPVSLK